MKHILTTTILVATAAFAFAEEKSITDKTRDAAREAKTAVVDAARNVSDATQAAWKKTKAYVSEDPATFREGANQTLTDLSAAIADVKSKAPPAPPKYFNTRIRSLDEQLDHAKGTLADLTPEQIKSRMSGPRHAFDKCVDGLESAVSEAKSEAVSLSKVPQK